MAAPRNGKNHAWSLGLALTLPLVAGVGPVWAQEANPEPEDPAPTARPSLAPTAGDSLAPAAPAEPRVLISEVVVQGADGHPEQERMEIAVYDAMATRPGSRVTRSELQTDLSAIYASGWFSDVRIQPVDSPLGVRLVVTVVPNPVLTKVELQGASASTKLPENLLPDIFAADYGKTLNLNALQARIAELQSGTPIRISLPG